MPSQPQRGQGQWALGLHEPLNPAERFKKDDDGLNVRDRIVNRYAHLGFDSIDPSDLRGRFRWWGLYTQRKPGIGGGKTGALEDAEIEDPYFMMRVRIPGGQLTADQLRAIAEIAKEYGRDLADVTDRQNVQFHWIRIEDVPAIWERLEEVGLSSQQACGDVPRNILGCPVAGIDAAEIIDASAVAAGDRGGRHQQPGPDQPAAQVQDGDLRLRQPVHRARGQRRLVRRRHRPGRHGRATTCGSAAACRPTRCWPSGSARSCRPSGCRRSGPASPRLFRDYGYRRLRSRARLKFLVADWGAERFREVLETRVPGRERARRRSAAARPCAWLARPHRRAPAARRARTTSGVAPHTGRTSGTQLWQVADLAEAYGSGRIRTTIEQKLLILDVPERAVAELVAELEAVDLRPARTSSGAGRWPAPASSSASWRSWRPRAGPATCTPSSGRRLPDFDSPITINVNGCPNSCARFQLADIGLKGSIVDGEEGFQVHLGGSLGTDPGFGRKLRGLKVTAAGLHRLRRAAAAQLPGRPGRGRGVRRLGAARRSGAADPG